MTKALETVAPDEIVSIADSAAIIQVIERAASDPNTDVDKMERLLAMHERILERNGEQAFNTAMTEAQAGMTPVSADAINSHTKTKYASYAQLDRALRPIYTEHGFSLSFDSGDGALEKHVRVLCYVGHRNGFTRTYHADIPADGKGAKGGDVMTLTHAAGAAFTYGQRYLLKLIFNVAVGEGDTDGNTVITAEQKDTIIKLIRETESDTGKFLKFLGAESVDLIPAGDYLRARRALEAKASK